MVRPKASLIFPLLVVASCAGTPQTARQDRLSAGDLRKSGTVRLAVTCKPEVREDFQTAVALLHSFFYVEAKRRFAESARFESW